MREIKQMQMNGVLLENLLHQEEGPALDFKLWLAPIVRPRNGRNKVHLDGCNWL